MTNTTYIALVDDHVLLRAALAALINSFDGYRVLFEADHGAHFIELLKPRQPPDIILLDITMPTMNGYETASWIRQNLPDAKVVVLSMMENDAAIIRMLKAGAKGYLLKDTKPPILLQALNQVRDEGFYLNELISNKMLYYMNSQGGRQADQLPVQLSDRELQFLRYVCTEKTYKEIAAEMFVSPRTVDSYRDGLFEKLGLTSRIGLVLYAIKNGLVMVT